MVLRARWRPRVTGWTTNRARTATLIALAAMMLVYAVLAGGLALRRHANLGSQALDMGYADQVTWNVLHGHGLRFTLFRGEVGAEEGRALQFGPGADRDSLLAYHVELLFFPIALLYLLHPGPETLIVLLTVTLALGALPAYWIACRQLGHRGAGLAFAALYLLFPSVQAANLADFHAVSMTASVLLFAFWALLERRYRLWLALCVVSAAAKEEVGLVVAMLGLYAWLVQGERRRGLVVAGSAVVWVALCFGVIIPHFSGGAPSLFAARYADAIHRARVFPAEVLAGHAALPLPDYAVRYALHLLSSTGFLALLGPLQLAVAAPAVAVNGLSGSVWQHGGGAHYSAETVPALVVAAIFGTRWLAQRAWQRFKLPPSSAALAIALLGLAGGVAETWQQGILPPSRHFSWPAPADHAARLDPLLARIPLGAAVSAQSNVFPHLSDRPKAYVFPAIEDATYVLVDVFGTSDPLYPDQLFPEVQALLANERFTLLAGDDGYLLFQRAADGHGSGSLSTRPPEPFYRFALPSNPEPYTPEAGSFGGVFDVVGYRLEPLPEVNFSQRRVVPTLYLRARQPIQRAYRLTTFIVERDGLARNFDDGNATQLWLPTYRWQPGELVRVRYPPITYSPGERLGVGAQVGTAPDASRLQASDTLKPALDHGYVVELGPLP